MVVSVETLAFLASGVELSLQVKSKKAVKFVFFERVDIGRSPLPQTVVVVFIQFELRDLA
jgi:hypothetical protein